MPISVKVPKSPVLGQQRHIMQSNNANTAASTASLMTTSLTSGQVLANAGNLSDALMLNLHPSANNQQQLPLLMSTSLNSGGGGGDQNGVGVWNSTSSLSPTSSAAQQQNRKSEVKLNAMP